MTYGRPEHVWGADAPTFPERWGRLAARYADPTKPRRMLTVDGGGIRGVVSLQVLGRLEAQLAAHYDARGVLAAADFRLSRFFDYVAGTSSGAIIASGIARGMTVAEIEQVYRDHGHEIFDPRPKVQWIESMYNDGSIERLMKARFGEHTTLAPSDLETLLMVVTRNTTTDSVWPISSNPDAVYNDPARSNCNLHIPLWHLVRASTAAPGYFPPEEIGFAADDPSQRFVFVDGGTTAYNNPAALLLRMATDPAYCLGWTAGEDQLLVVSVGAGAMTNFGAAAGEQPTSAAGKLIAPLRKPVDTLVGTLRGMFSQTSYDQDMTCRTLGRCAFGPPVDREVGDLVVPEGQPTPGAPRWCRYLRYDAELSQRGLAWIAGPDAANPVPELDTTTLQSLDAVDAIDGLAAFGQALAGRVSLEHLGPFLGVPLSPGLG